MNNYWIMFFAGLFGIILYILRKIKGIRKRMRKDVTESNATWKQVFTAYFTNDWINIVTSLVVVLIAMFLIVDYMKIPKDQPIEPGTTTYYITKVIKFMRTGFIVIGFTANSILDAFAGKTEYVIDAINKKNNVDKKEGEDE